MPHSTAGQHCRELDRCNQRGGRMLSIVDLLDAGTVDLKVASYLAAAISGGASFLTGAVPGGAGKTTIMAALLNFLPPDVPIIHAEGPETIRTGINNGSDRTCYLCQEIGSGGVPGYLWGEDARDFFSLTRHGHVVATNLHCDTLDQTCEQLCGTNPVDETDFLRVNVMAFISIAGSGGARQHRLATIWESDGQSPHRLVFQWDAERDAFEQTAKPHVPRDRIEAFKPLLQQLVRDEQRTIQQVRSRVVEFLKAG